MSTEDIRAQYECSPSTTWAYRKVKIQRRPQGSAKRRPKGSSGPLLRRRDPKEALSMRVTYRGGAEAWWKIEARGEVYIAPGHLCLHDVMMSINDGNPGAARGGSKTPGES